MAASGTVRLVFDERFLEYRFGPGHPFREADRRLAVRLLGETIPSDGGRPVAWDRRVELADRASLERFHRSEYLDLVRARSDVPEAPPFDAGDTPSFPGCYPASARLAGGALAGLQAIADGAAVRAFHPAGGLHHAHPDRASGFCIVNDLAVAIAHAVGPGRPYARVAYVDLDAHHGDGVMYGFYGDGRVLDIDLHQDGRTLFPGTGSVPETGTGDGAGAKVNVPLPPGAGDDVLVRAVRRIVPTLVRAHRPDLLVVQHGVDGGAGDPLSQLRYGPAGYAAVLTELLALADELCGGRLLLTGGGGYRAETVALQLARAGHRLLGGPPPTGPLPDGWRTEFQREVGTDAPVEWPAEPEVRSTDRAGRIVDPIVDELGRALGVAFPAPSERS